MDASVHFSKCVHIDTMTIQCIYVIGCYYMEMIYRHGDLVAQSDPCQMCLCSVGNVVCTSMPCPALPDHCRQSAVPLGPCCLQCPQFCIYRGKMYKPGDVISKAMQNVCEQCVCEDGQVKCTPVSCRSLGPCQSTVVPDEECCPVCADCGQWPNGATWDEGPCFQCTCQVRHL